MICSRPWLARLSAAVLAVAAALFLAAPAMSQGNPPVFNNAPTIAPLPSVCSSAVPSIFALGDVTGHLDNTLDLVMICGRNIVTVPGKGDGTFVTASAQITPMSGSFAGQISQISLADIDGDGNLDLVATDSSCNLDVFLGTGAGTFSGTPTQTTEGLSPCGTAPSTFFVANFKGHGNPDIAVENGFSGAPSIIVLINGSTPGTVSFSGPVSIALGIPANSPTQQFGGMAVGKFTGQSVPDLAIAIGNYVSGAGFTTSVYVLRNNGSGTGFTAVLPGVTLPATPTTGTLVGLVAANLSSDGFVDVAGVDSSDGAIFVLYGHGTGNLTTCSSSTPPITSCQTSAGQTITGLPPLYFTRQLLAGNFNGPSGPPGLLFESVNECISVLLGAAGGGLQTTATTYVVGNSSTGVVVGDVNNDGYADAIVSARNGLSVFLNNTGGTLEGTRAFLTGTAPGVLSLLNNFFGNGEKDVAVVPFTGATPATVTVLGAPASGPNGTLPQLYGPQPIGVTSTATVTAMTSGCLLVNSAPCAIPFVAAATYDQNSGTSTASIIYLSPITGLLTLPTTIFSILGPPGYQGGASALAAGDFNGDGKTDLAFAFGTQNTIEVFVGNGDGTFSSTPVTISLGANQNPVALAVADFDGDGQADLAVLNQTANTVGILLNNTSNCSGGAPLCFAPMASYPVGFSSPAGFTVGDFNGDTKPDIAVVGSPGIAILLNQGGGVFPNTAPTPLLLPPSTFADAIATGDFNGDGILDLAVALPFIPDSVEILNGIGDGTFATATATFWSAGANPAVMVVADFNGDGKLDIAVADADPEGQTVALLLNGTAAATAPPPPATPVISPDGGNFSSAVSVTITDSTPGATIYYTTDGSPPAASSTMYAGSFMVGTSETINAIAITSGFSQSLVATAAFTITLPPPLPPQISTVTPNIGAQGQLGLQVTITGMNFVAGATTTVTFGGGMAGITVPSYMVNSATSITATLNIAQTTLAGNYDVVVTVGGVPSTPPGEFTVAVAVPTVPETITVSDQVTVTPLVLNFAPPAAFYSASTVGFASGATQTLTVSNVGGTALAFSGAPVITAVSGTFSIMQTLCYDGSTTFPAMLPSGGACTLTIMALGTPANDSGAIVFTDNAALSSPASMGTGPNNYTQSIALTGTGTTMVGQPPSGMVTIPTIPETIIVNDRVGLSVTTLISSNPNAYENTQVTLTATVQAAASGNPTPTGTVTFFDGQTPLTGTSTIPNPATLVSGTATYTTSSLAVGIHLLTAVYSGDMNFPGSSSQVLVETISLPGAFSLSANPASLTIQQGQSGTTTITVTSTGYAGPLTLSCPVLPSYASCVFGPPPNPYLAASGPPLQIKLTIFTTGVRGAGSVGGPAGSLDSHSMRPGRIPPVLPAGMVLLIGMLVLAAELKHRKNLLVRLALIALLTGLGLLTACYNYGTPTLPGTLLTPTGQANVVVSVSGGGAAQTLNLPVTITPTQ